MAEPTAPHYVRWDQYVARWLKDRIGYILWVIYMLLLCVAIPLSVSELVSRHAEKHIVVWFVAGVFVYVTIPITTSGVIQHLCNFSDPPQQKRIIRILMMVPVYSFFSYLGMILKDETIYLNAMRECYESYVIYNFMMFLVTYMYEHYNVEQLLTYKPAQPQLFPFQKLPPWPKGKAFMIWSKRGVFVYVVSKPITTFVMLLSEVFGHSGKNEFKIGSVWMWTLIIDNFAQMWALYCLVIFYQALKHELAPIKPLPKFLCVKAVVFFSFWQGTFLEFLVLIGIIRDHSSKDPDGYTADETAETVQNLLICIEMFGFSIAHHLVFSHKPYVSDHELPPPQFLTSLSHLFDFGDVRTDIRTQLGVSYYNLRRGGRNTEQTPLITGEHVELETFRDYRTNC